MGQVSGTKLRSVRPFYFNSFKLSSKYVRQLPRPFASRQNSNFGESARLILLVPRSANFVRYVPSGEHFPSLWPSKNSTVGVNDNKLPHRCLPFGPWVEATRTAASSYPLISMQTCKYCCWFLCTLRQSHLAEKSLPFYTVTRQNKQSAPGFSTVSRYFPTHSRAPTRLQSHDTDCLPSFISFHIVLMCISTAFVCTRLVRPFSYNFC